MHDLKPDPAEYPDQPKPKLDPTRRYRCRHVFTDGHRCGSPALRGFELCYYHRASRQDPPCGTGRTAESTVFVMPRIDDRAGIQLALYNVLARLASLDIDRNRAATLLYGLQIASANLPRLAHPAGAEPIVEDITDDYQLGDLAPIAEFTEPQPPAIAPPAPAPAPQATTLKRSPKSPILRKFDPETGMEFEPDLEPDNHDYASDPPLSSTPLRDFTPAEHDHLDLTVFCFGYEPGRYPRPESLTDQDIIGRVNGERAFWGHPPLTPIFDDSGALSILHSDPKHPGARPLPPLPPYVSSIPDPAPTLAIA